MDYNVGQIILPPEEVGGFSRVPNWVFSLALSDQARLLIAWAAGRPRGWVPTVKDIKWTLAFGKDKWRRLVSELEPLEVIVQSKARSGGRTTHSLIIDLRPLCPQSAQNPTIAREPQVLLEEARKTGRSRDARKDRPSDKEEFRTKKDGASGCGQLGGAGSALAHRREKAGWQVMHSELGLLTVCPDPWLWLSDAGTIAGARSERIWQAVERGELTLSPPAGARVVDELGNNSTFRGRTLQLGSRGAKTPWPTISAEPKCSGLRDGSAGEVTAP